MFVYDVKIHETFEKMEVLSKNGLSIKIDLSFRYNPVEEEIGYLHDQIGRDYVERIIKLDYTFYIISTNLVMKITDFFFNRVIPK